MMAKLRVVVAVVAALTLVERASCLHGGRALRAPRRAVAAVQMRGRPDAKQCMAALAMFAVVHLGGIEPAFADGSTETFKFPPIDTKKVGRCKFVSSAMGQANAARDSLYDLRECKMDKMSAGSFDISGALMAAGSFQGADFKEAQLSKASAPARQPLGRPHAPHRCTAAPGGSHRAARPAASRLTPANK